jgi:hypothetical protein
MQGTLTVWVLSLFRQRDAGSRTHCSSMDEQERATLLRLTHAISELGELDACNAWTHSKDRVKSNPTRLVRES